MTTEMPTAPDEVEEGRQEPLFVYFLLGIFLGTLFIKGELASWFRIQEMFHFHSIHMYGVIGGAVGVGALSLALMKRFGVRTIRGDEIRYPQGDDVKPRPQHILGGICFGLGWGFVGACPGPLVALVGSGAPIMIVGLLSAVVGAWVYGLLRPMLPH